MKTNLIPFPSNRFTFYKTHKVFIADSSDLLGNHFQHINAFGGEVGFTIQSVKTQKKVTYVLSHVRRDGENEITYWKYVPTIESIHDVPGCTGTSATIFNDW